MCECLRVMPRLSTHFGSQGFWSDKGDMHISEVPTVHTQTVRITKQLDC